MEKTTDFGIFSNDGRNDRFFFSSSFSCDKCDFACNTSLNLDIHMQTHGGGK